MAVLSVMSIQGQPDELVARMEEAMMPIARRKAAEYGGISSTVVRTDDGITIYNLWQTEEGRHRMAEDQEVRAAMADANFPAPAFVGYEVLLHNTTGEAAQEVVRRFTDEVWNKGNLDFIDEVVAPEYHGWDPTTGDIQGPAALRDIVQMYRSAFPNMEMTIDLIVSDGDWVITKWTARGTNTGELMGMPATGKDATVSGIQMERIVGGKFVESHGIFDALGMLQQMGVVPAGAAQPAHA